MDGTGFSVLTAIIFIPIIAGVVILFLDRKNRDLVRGIGITAASAVLALSLAVFFGYDNFVKSDGGLISEQRAMLESGAELSGAQMFADALAFEQRIVWVESLGIAYHVGVDGVSAPMVLLTGMVAVAGVLISWNIQDRLREFMAFFMFLVAGVYGVFIAVDLFMLFFFYELAIFPMYLLIAGWGWVKLREYAAMKLTLYILVGSVFALVGAVAMYFAAGAFFAGSGADVFEAALASGVLPADSQPYSWSITQLTLAAENGAFSLDILGIEGFSFARFWFPFMFMGFGVLAGVFPFHNWSPDGHVAAPTAVSMIHAGVLMKVGAFAALRAGVQLLPDGADTHLPWIVFLTLINVVYGALIAFRQRDFKYVIGFSSVSHMGLVSMGWATMNLTGMTGAGIQMFSHGAMTALFFGVVGMVYDRSHTRDIPSLGGFIAEFPIFQGMWAASEQITLQLGSFQLSNYYGVMVVIAASGIVITAAYVLRVAGQVFFGEFDTERFHDVGNIDMTDRIVLIILGAPLIILGLYPPIMAPMIESGIRPLIALLGGG